MSEWTKVVTSPLGLAGFALFLVFGYLAKLKRSNERRWLAPLAVFAAIAALVGGRGSCVRSGPEVYCAIRPSQQTASNNAAADEQQCAANLDRRGQSECARCSRRRDHHGGPE